MNESCILFKDRMKERWGFKALAPRSTTAVGRAVPRPGHHVRRADCRRIGCSREAPRPVLSCGRFTLLPRSCRSTVSVYSRRITCWLTVRTGGYNTCSVADQLLFRRQVWTYACNASCSGLSTGSSP